MYFSSACHFPKRLPPASNLPHDFRATESVRWVEGGGGWIFPWGLHSRDSAQNSHDALYRWGRLCCFQVKMARKGGKSTVCLMLKQMDVITLAGGCHLGWGEPLICHSLSLLVVPAGLVAGSKQDRWDFNWVHLLICPYVPQQNTFLMPASKKKLFMNHPTTSHLTSHHHITSCLWLIHKADSL